MKKAYHDRTEKHFTGRRQSRVVELTIEVLSEHNLANQVAVVKDDVEARETHNGAMDGRPVNSSIFVTKFILNGDFDGDGTVGLSEAINALKAVSGN